MAPNEAPHHHNRNGEHKVSTASEQAAAQMVGGAADRERVGAIQGETGDYARFRALMRRDDFTDDETTEFADLAGKWRAGTLEGRAKRTVYKRESVAGDNDRNGVDSGHTAPPSPTAASEAAAAQIAWL